ncbi:ABC transporter substrate-binding protein [Aquabacterium sp. A7-Y]|uniref:ABC transporter substrate-binding protein n=1 Tax=Aquabacterium sp. A7-Y TaxID=1349605 RepID=UPI00223DF6BC|nr:ABC transporter substrate-binding protein [Aquabacterium sp. A7-Y]MCW7538200.1 ABC transporter substrate-binding protein [Aquabacterium sp. A7-Y]
MTHRLATTGLLARVLGCLAALFACLSAHAADPPTLKLAVGGKATIYYLPLTIAERKGFFKDEGLNVEVTDFNGGSKALQALVGGSADMAAGSFEHVVAMAAKGQPIQSAMVLGRHAGVVLALSPERAATYRSPKDLAGARIGVTAPGSGTHMFLNSWMTRNGVDPKSVSIVGVGSGAAAVAAIRSKQVDAIANLDPVMTLLQREQAIKVIVDGRTDAGMQAAYGSPYAAAALFGKPEYIEQHAESVERLVKAVRRAVVWMQQATPEAIADTVPSTYYTNKDDYIAALRQNLPSFAPNMAMTPEVAANVLKVLQQFDPLVAAARVDLGKTYSNRFVDTRTARSAP